VLPSSPDRYMAKLAAWTVDSARGIVAPRSAGAPTRLMEWSLKGGCVRWATDETLDWSALRSRIEADPRWRDALEPVTAWAQSLVDAAMEAEDNKSRVERRPRRGAKA